jgi:cell division protein FtsL
VSLAAARVLGGARRPVAAGRPALLARVVRRVWVRRLMALGGVLVLASILHVWLRLQVIRLGYELSAARTMQLRLEHERRELEIELATLRDPARIAQGARRLGMTAPRAGQVTILP